MITDRYMAEFRTLVGKHGSDGYDERVAALRAIARDAERGGIAIGAVAGVMVTTLAGGLLAGLCWALLG